MARPEEAAAPVEIRQALNADYDRIAQTWHASASLPGVAAQGVPDVAALRQRIDMELADDWDLSVATRANAIIGMLAIRIGKGILDQLFVHPAEIGTGVGRALLAHAIRAMPDGFTLHTASSNASARRFYERSGLALLEIGTHPRGGYAIAIYGQNRGQ